MFGSRMFMGRFFFGQFWARSRAVPAAAGGWTRLPRDTEIWVRVPRDT
jgi:hypothetical protein